MARYRYIKKLIQIILENKIIQKIIEKIINSSHNVFLLSFLGSLLSNNQCVFNFGGLNLSLHHDKYIIAIKKQINNTFIFNGCVGDHFLFIPTSKETYYQSPIALYETINIDRTAIDMGLIWTHFQPIKTNPHIFDESFIIFTLEDLKKMPWKHLIHSINEYFDHSSYNYQLYTKIGKKFWNHDKKYLADRSYQKTLDDLLPKCINYINNKKTPSL
ncbi:MAG: hypothetical protein ACRCV0_07230 [Brevinema sp.]